MKQIALTIGGSGQPTFNLSFPSQIAAINTLHLQDLISFAVSFVLVVAVLLSFFFFLFGGLKWMLSQGDKKQVEEAQKTLMYSIIGLVIVFLSFFIVNIIGFLFGVKLI